jgi:hypothetical protein
MLWAPRVKDYDESYLHFASGEVGGRVFGCMSLLGEIVVFHLQESCIILGFGHTQQTKVVWGTFYFPATVLRYNRRACNLCR